LKHYYLSIYFHEVRLITIGIVANDKNALGFLTLLIMSAAAVALL
jgi:hypothetical protein